MMWCMGHISVEELSLIPFLGQGISIDGHPGLETRCWLIACRAMGQEGIRCPCTLKICVNLSLLQIICSEEGLEDQALVCTEECQ